jgi:hypothetical protein
LQLTRGPMTDVHAVVERVGRSAKVLGECVHAG